MGGPGSGPKRGGGIKLGSFATLHKVHGGATGKIVGINRNERDYHTRKKETWVTMKFGNRKDYYPSDAIQKIHPSKLTGGSHR